MVKPLKKPNEPKGKTAYEAKIRKIAKVQNKRPEFGIYVWQICFRLSANKVYEWVPEYLLWFPQPY